MTEVTFFLSPTTLSSAEAHKGAPRGGERAAVPPPRLQQGFHNRPISAATHQGHPHRWGPGFCSAPFLTHIETKLESILVPFSLLLLDEILDCRFEGVLVFTYKFVTLYFRGEELHLWPVWPNLQTEETLVCSPAEAFRGEAATVSSSDAGPLKTRMVTKQSL